MGNDMTMAGIPACVKDEAYYGELCKYKVYLHRGNYSRFIIKFLQKHGVKHFEEGNDAPRGGRVGAYVKFTPTKQLREIIKALSEEAKQHEERTLAFAESLGINRETTKQYLKVLRENRPVNYRKGYSIAYQFRDKTDMIELNKVRRFYFFGIKLP